METEATAVETRPVTNVWSGKIWPALRPYVSELLRFSWQTTRKGAQWFWTKYMAPIPTRYVLIAVAICCAFFELGVGCNHVDADYYYKNSRKIAAYSVADLLQQGKRERAANALRVGDLLVDDGTPCYVTRIDTDPSPRAICRTSLGSRDFGYSRQEVLDPKVTIVPVTASEWRSYMLRILELSTPAPPPSPSTMTPVAPVTEPLVRF